MASSTNNPQEGSSSSMKSENPPAERRPWACHVPCCGRWFASSTDLATHLASCQSPDRNEEFYVGSLVNLMRKNKYQAGRNNRSEADEHKTKNPDVATESAEAEVTEKERAEASSQVLAEETNKQS